MDVGENIRSTRKQRGFTQEELAQQLGVTPQAVSRWELGNGMPDISLLVPLAQILGVTTDAILGMGMESYDEAYLREILNRKKEILEKEGEPAQKHLGAYYYFRDESDKNPMNYQVMLECVGQGSEISRYVDFNDFLKENPQEWEKIRQDCIKKAVCVIRYCRNHVIVEKTHFSLAWIYIHSKEYDKAKEHINVLPSMDSNMMKEPIMAQLIMFEQGFDAEKVYLQKNMYKLSGLVSKELFYAAQDYNYYKPYEQGIEFSNWALKVADSFIEDKKLLPRWWRNICKIQQETVKNRLRAKDVRGVIRILNQMYELFVKYQRFCKLSLEGDLSFYSDFVIQEMRQFTDNEYVKKLVMNKFEECMRHKKLTEPVREDKEYQDLILKINHWV